MPSHINIHFFLLKPDILSDPNIKDVFLYKPDKQKM